MLAFSRNCDIMYLFDYVEEWAARSTLLAYGRSTVRQGNPADAVRGEYEQKRKH